MRHGSPFIGTPSGDGPDEAQVRAQLRRLVESGDFEANERRRKFLSYVVEETFAGRADRLKGFTIGQAVFDRGDDFDAQSDPVVRLEARRLRRDLDGYYAGTGAKDPVRISIPKGGYVPQFAYQHAPAAEPAAEPAADIPVQPAPVVPSARPRKRLHWVLALLAVFLIPAAAAAGYYYLVAKPNARPLAVQDDFAKVAVLPFEPTDPSETSKMLAVGLSWEVVQNLKTFAGLRVFQPKKPTDLYSVLDKWRQNPGANYLIRGQVLSAATTVEISVQLLDAISEEVLWSESYDVALTPETVMDVRDDVSGEIATVISGPYGPLAKNVWDSRSNLQPGSMESYLCLLQAHEYRRGFSERQFAPTLKCLQEAVERQPDYADAWAMLGWLRLDAARMAFPGTYGKDTELSLALDAASRAVDLDPKSTLALKSLSAVNHHMGNFAESEALAKRALEINPHDPDTLAQLGWRMGVRGEFEESVPYMLAAVDKAAQPLGWYYNVLAIYYLMDGDYAEMQRVANLGVEGVHGTDGDFQLSIALVAMAAAEAGDEALVKKAMASLDPDFLFARDPEGFLDNFKTTDAITDTMIASFQKARDIAGWQ